MLLGQDNVHGRRGEDRQECEELPKEDDGQKEKMDGTGDKNTMIIVHVCTLLSYLYYLSKLTSFYRNKQQSYIEHAQTARLS